MNRGNNRGVKTSENSFCDEWEQETQPSVSERRENSLKMSRHIYIPDRKYRFLRMNLDISIKPIFEYCKNIQNTQLKAAPSWAVLV